MRKKNWNNRAIIPILYFLNLYNDDTFTILVLAEKYLFVDLLGSAHFQTD